MTEFRLPDVGEGLEQAEIVEWLVQAGEVVTRDQPLVEILTDKSQTQLPSPQEGTITSLGFAEGDIAHVGDVLVVFEGSSTPSATETTPAQGSVPSPGQPAGGAAQVSLSPGQRPKAAPVVRRRALDAGIDLASVTGTGPGGRITISDLDHHLRGPAPSPGTPTPPAVPAPIRQATGAVAQQLGAIDPGVHPLRGIRRVTAESMMRSWDIPHITGSDEADATELLAARRRIREQEPDAAAALTPLAFLVLAVANGLRRHPMMNASIDTAAGTITVHEDVNIGIAVASEQGLYVPVIRHADRRSLFGLADEIARLTAEVRNGTISVADMQGGTATISNYGSLGGRFATPIIRAPEVCIVGFGSIRPRPFVYDGEVVARQTLPISTAVDHRLIDGDLLTTFQEYIRSQVSDPVTLLAR